LSGIYLKTGEIAVIAAGGVVTKFSEGVVSLGGG